MSSHNRHLRGNTMEVLAPVMAKTTIEAGDLVYYNQNESYQIRPLNHYRSSVTTVDIYDYFAGVAMEASESGTTENISVATAGVFRYPLIIDSAVTLGFAVSAVTGNLTGAAVSNQYVSNHNIGGTSCFLGVIVKTDTSATSFVDFQLRTSGGLGRVTATVVGIPAT